jgi:WD40 repeat protein
VQIRHLALGLLACAVLSPGDAASDEPKPKAAPKLDHFGDTLPDGARLRLGTERFRHGGTGRIPLAMSPDGKFIVSFSGGFILRFDAETGRIVHRMPWDEVKSFDLAVTPDGKRIVTVGYIRDELATRPMGALRVWDAKTLAELKSFRWPEGTTPTRVALIAEGKIAAVADNAGVQIRDLEGTEEPPRLPVVGVRDLAASPDGSLIAIGDQNGTIHLWEWRTKKDPRKIELRGVDVSLAFSPDGKTLAIASDGVSLWDVETGKRIRLLPYDSTAYVKSVAFTPDGKQLITPDQGMSLDKNISGGLHIWDVATGKEARFLATPGEGFGHVTLSNDGGRLAAASGGSVRVWDTKTWKQLADHPTHRADVESIAISKDGLVLTGSMDFSARLWTLKDGAAIHRFQCAYWARSVAMTPDGSRAAALSNGDELLVWDTVSGKTLYQLPGHSRTGSPHFMGISDDGKSLLSFGPDLYLRVTDLNNGRAIHQHAIRPKGFQVDEEAIERFREFSPQDAAIRKGAFTPDGKLLLLTVNADIRVFETSTGKELHRIGGWSSFSPFAISPDSKRLLIVERPPLIRDPNGKILVRPKHETVRMLKIENGEAIGSMLIKDVSIWAIACAPDNKHFAVAVNTPEPLLFFCAFGADAPLKSYKLTAMPTRAMAFSPDGKSLAVGVTGGSVLVYDVQVGKDK